MCGIDEQLKLLDEILSKETPESLAERLDKYPNVGPTIEEYLNMFCIDDPPTIEIAGQIYVINSITMGQNFEWNLNISIQPKPSFVKINLKMC